MGTVIPIHPVNECGECGKCCKRPLIPEGFVAGATAEPGAPCSWLALDGGCQSYDKRPPVCKLFLCGYRTHGLDVSLRPDNVGFVYQIVNDKLYILNNHEMAEGSELVKSWIAQGLHVSYVNL